MNVPEELKYTAEHEWVLPTADNTRIRVGITDFAQDALGDVVFVDLPSAGQEVDKGGPVGELESHKSVSELYAPLTGTVSAVNEQLSDNPQLLNEDPYGEGWLLEIEPANPAEVDGLLDAAAYRALTEGE